MPASSAIDSFEPTQGIRGIPQRIRSLRGAARTDDDSLTAKAGRRVERVFIGQIVSQHPGLAAAKWPGRCQGGERGAFVGAGAPDLEYVIAALKAISGAEVVNEPARQSFDRESRFHHFAPMKRDTVPLRLHDRWRPGIQFAAGGFAGPDHGRRVAMHSTGPCLRKAPFPAVTAGDRRDLSPEQ